MNGEAAQGLQWVQWAIATALAVTAVTTPVFFLFVRNDRRVTANETMLKNEREWRLEQSKLNAKIFGKLDDIERLVLERGKPS